MRRPLPAQSRRLTGLMLMISGVLMALGLFIRLVLAAYLWARHQAGPEALPLGVALVNLLGLVAAGLLVRYGRRLRRGGGAGPDAETLG